MAKKKANEDVFIPGKLKYFKDKYNSIETEQYFKYTEAEMEEYEKDKSKKETKKLKATVVEICEKIEKIKTKAKIEEFRSWVNNVKSYNEEQKNVMLRKLEEQEKVCE